MNSILRVYALLGPGKEFTIDLFFEDQIVSSQSSYQGLDFDGWTKWKVLKYCTEKGWNHAVYNPLPAIIQNMNKLIPEPFPIKLDPKRVRLPMKALLQILEAIANKPKDFPVIHQSELLGIGERRYLHITAQAGNKNCYLAFGVRGSAVVNCMACVNSAEKEWTIDDDDNIPMWPLDLTQKLSGLLLRSQEREIKAIPCWKVSIQTEPGVDSWCGYGPMYDFGPTKTGISYPKTLEANIIFYSKEEAEEAARKAQIYHDQRAKERSKEKKK